MKNTKQENLGEAIKSLDKVMKIANEKFSEVMAVWENEKLKTITLGGYECEYVNDGFVLLGEHLGLDDLRGLIRLGVTSFNFKLRDEVIKVSKVEVKILTKYLLYDITIPTHH